MYRSLQLQRSNPIISYFFNFHVKYQTERENTVLFNILFININVLTYLVDLTDKLTIHGKVHTQHLYNHYCRGVC